jgi:predicted nucleotidyltransferase
MARSNPQSALRYPLTRILGVDANVRVLRELAGHGGVLSAPALVVRSGLAQSSVRAALIDLEATKVVEAIGSGRARLFRIGKRHPLAAAIGALFRAEQRRFDAVLEAVRAGAAGSGPGVIAVWLYGSVARGQDRAESDVDIAVVAEATAVPRVEETLREELRSAEEKLAFRASVLAVDVDDVVRLSSADDPWWTSTARDAMSVVGDRPDALLARLRRGRKSRRKAS